MPDIKHDMRAAAHLCRQAAALLGEAALIGHRASRDAADALRAGTPPDAGDTILLSALGVSLTWAATLQGSATLLEDQLRVLSCRSREELEHETADIARQGRRVTACLTV